MEKVFLSCLINQQQVHYDVINQDICSIFPGLKFRLQVGWNTKKCSSSAQKLWTNNQSWNVGLLGPADKLIVLTVCSLYLGHPRSRSKTQWMLNMAIQVTGRYLDITFNV